MPIRCPKPPAPFPTEKYPPVRKVVTEPAQTLTEVRVGEWAHVRANTRQHLVVALDGPSYAPVRMACGHTTFARAIWHAAREPHLPRCKRCESREG